MPENVIIIGAGGHGRVIADIVKSMELKVLGFLDDKRQSEEGLTILGKIMDAPNFADSARFVIGIGDNKTRLDVARRFEGSLQFLTAVHKSAVIAEDVRLGEGSVVMAGAVINPGTVIGRHCVINTSASVDHDCALSDFVHVSPGAHLAGNVSLGEGTWLGIGGIAINGVSVCPWCVIGAGGVVIRDLNKPGTYVGVPVVFKAAP